MFMGKVPTVGVPHLPSIYREMAHSLFVDTLDLRVYSPLVAVCGDART
jgi:hypothetical protein